MPSDDMQPDSLYQRITDVCFENGGVSKRMVDKLHKLFEQELALYDPKPDEKLTEDESKVSATDSSISQPDQPVDEQRFNDLMRRFRREQRMVLNNDGVMVEDYSLIKEFIQAECNRARQQLKANVFVQFRYAMQKQELSARPPEGARFRTPLEELSLILEANAPLAELQQPSNKKEEK